MRTSVERNGTRPHSYATSAGRSSAARVRCLYVGARFLSRFVVVGRLLKTEKKKNRRFALIRYAPVVQRARDGDGVSDGPACSGTRGGKVARGLRCLRSV